MESVTKALTGAAVMYGVPWDSDQLRAYLAILSQTGASDERLARGVFSACAVCKFMPKPADIIEHMPQYITQAKALPAYDDDYIPPEDMAFNRAAFPLLNEYLAGKITRYDYLARLRWEAKKAGVEGKIAWRDFGDDTPWNPKRMEANAS